MLLFYVFKRMLSKCCRADLEFVSFANFVLLTNVFCSHLSSHEHVDLPAPYAPCRGSDSGSGNQGH